MHPQEFNRRSQEDPAAHETSQKPGAPTATAKNSDSRRRFAFWVCVILAVHLQLSLYAIPPASVTSGRPFGNPDYQTHYAQTTTLSEGLDRFGKMWVYDPDMLAGTPVGLIFDVDNKFHFLFTYALTKLGVPRPTAFNLFAVLSFFLLPFSLLFAARLFALRPRGQLFALGLGLLIWHFDSAARFAWSGGMISYATATHLALPIWALFFRMLKEHSSRYFFPLLLLLPLSLLVHVWSFAILVVPMIGLYINQRRQLDFKDHLRVWGLAGAGILLNLFWLYPALRYFHLFSPSGRAGQTNPIHILTEYLEIMVDPLKTGFVMPFTIWRVVAAAAALLVLMAWREKKDGRFFYASLSLSWLFGLTFFAVLIPGLRQTEPFRFVGPFELMAALVGAGWLSETARLSALRSWPRPAQAAVLTLLLLVLPRAVAPVLYFMPELRPSAHFSPVIIDPEDPQEKGAAFPGGFQDNSPPGIWRLLPTDGSLMALSTYVREQCTTPGRILVQSWPVGEHLYWATGKPVIGGFPERRQIHEAANLFHDPTDKHFCGQEFADYLVRYNIRYLVVTDAIPVLERRLGLLELEKLIGPHRVYRTRHQGNYFQRGSGTVKAGLNRIEVTEAEPHPGTEELILRFHHMSTLRCRPNCLVRKAPLADDPAGFITVVGNPELPLELVVEHVY